ncbi:hypothetical protein CB1_000123009 [Camelus ferus]|nr:hypothetical protein CB1_000123009 [Camelus ferus]
MENYLFSLKSTLDTWLGSSCTFRVPDIILGALCGLGLFFLITSCFQHPPKGRGRSRKKNGALEAPRSPRTRMPVVEFVPQKPNPQGGFWEGEQNPDTFQIPCSERSSCSVCHEELEEIQDLVLLLQSRPGPASSWLQPVPPVSCSHLGRFLDKGGFQHLYGQEPPDKTPLQDLSVTHWHPHGAPPHAARLHASQAPFWEDPTSRQVKASGLPFVTPDVQKLLEILITKRAGLKVRKEKGKEQGPGYHLDSSLKKAHPMAVPSSIVEVTCESGGHAKPQLTEVLEKPPQPQPEESVRTAESASMLLSPLLAPSCPCEKLPGGLGGSPPGDVREPPEASLIGQGDKLPSQAVTYKFIGRIWHNESVMGAEKGSLQQPSPSPPVARDEPRGETGGRASLDSCGSVTVVDLDKWPQSSKAQDTDPAWKSILDPGMMIRSQSTNVDQKESWSPRPKKSLSLSTQSVVLTPEDVYLDAQLRKLESQRFAKPEQQHMRVLLQDYETGVLLQDCAPSTLLQDCHSDMSLAADFLAAEASLSHSQTLSSGDMSVSQVLYDLSSSGGSSWGPQEPWGQQAPSKSQRKKSGEPWGQQAPSKSQRKKSGPTDA